MKGDEREILKNIISLVFSENTKVLFIASGQHYVFNILYTDYVKLINFMEKLGCKLFVDVVNKYPEVMSMFGIEPSGKISCRYNGKFMSIELVYDVGSGKKLFN